MLSLYELYAVISVVRTVGASDCTEDLQPQGSLGQALYSQNFLNSKLYKNDHEHSDLSHIGKNTPIVESCTFTLTFKSGKGCSDCMISNASNHLTQNKRVNRILFVPTTPSWRCMRCCLLVQVLFRTMVMEHLALFNLFKNRTVNFQEICCCYSILLND